MIKVKTFITNSQNISHLGRLDDGINDFLAKNDVEIIDIKYSIAIGGEGGRSFYSSAMLLYKTKD